MSTGNILQSIEKSFIGASKATISTIAEEAMMDFLRASGINSAQTFFQAQIIVARIGLEAKSQLSEEQKRLVTTNLSKFYTGPMDAIYTMLTGNIDDAEYDMIENFCRIGKQRVGIPLLTYILSFSYFDGEPSIVLKARLEAIIQKYLEV